MKLDDWQKQEREKRGTLFFGRKNELAELKAFLDDKNFRIFELYGVPMIGKTTLVREFLKSVANYEIEIIPFQNPEKPDVTLDRILTEINWQISTPRLIIIENFEEALKPTGHKDRLHEIRFEKIEQFLKDKTRLPFVKLILESRFKIKLDFLPSDIYTDLKNKQLGEIDREELFNHLNHLYRNDTVTYENFEKLCEKLNDHIWLIEMAMQNKWAFEDVLDAVEHPESITKKLWDKLQGIIRRLESPQKILLCAFAIVNPISEADLERHLKSLAMFQKQSAFEDGLWSLRKKLLAVYNVQNKSYEINPFLREVCITFLQNRREMEVLDALPYFHKTPKPKYDRMIQAHEKGDYGTFFKLVKEKRRAGKYDEVIDILQEAYWTNPKKEAILTEIGITYKWWKKWTEAKQYLKRALDVDPNDVKTFNELAIIYKEERNYHEAIKVLTKSLEINDKDVKTLNELAYVYKEQKNYDAAIRILKKAINIEPNIQVLNELGIVYKKQKNDDEAIRIFKELIEKHKHLPAYNELGRIYKAQKNYEEAIRIFKQAAGLGHVYSYNELAIVYKELGDLENALDTVQRGLKIEPKNPYLKNTLKRIQDLEDEISLQKYYKTDILMQKETLLKEKQESLSDLNDRKIRIDRNINKRIKKAKFWICAYFVFAWLITIILGRMIGWSAFEEWTFYIGLGLTILGIIYLVIMNEELDIRKFFVKLRDQYYQEECQKFTYTDEKVAALYESISNLQNEIRRLETPR